MSLLTNPPELENISRFTQYATRTAFFLKEGKNLLLETQHRYLSPFRQLIPKKSSTEPSQIYQSNKSLQGKVNRETKRNVNNILRKIFSSKKSAVEVKYSPVICTFFYVCIKKIIQKCDHQKYSQMKTLILLVKGHFKHPVFLVSEV